MSTCMAEAMRTEMIVRSDRDTTVVMARSRNRPRMASPTQISEVSPPGAKTLSNSGWIIQDSRPSVLPSIDMTTKAITISQTWGRR